MNQQIDDIIQALSTVILGKQHQIKLAVCCLLAKGHLLIEDVPGVGKTTLAHSLAHVMGLNYQRIQFTSDLLPADILGVSVYDRENASFKFHPGPIFSQLILADEVNRATPKAQSALLEAMEEHQITLEGETRSLPEPFFVIATQNPSHQIGTFPLPESQLDRFMMCIELGYPDPDAERALYAGEDRRTLLNKLQAVINNEQLIQLQLAIKNVETTPALLDYLQQIVQFTRNSADYPNGLSPRAGLSILQAAKAWALMQDRKHVLPEDIQAILPGVVSHRLRFSRATKDQPHDLAQQLIQQVAIP